MKKYIILYIAFKNDSYLTGALPRLITVTQAIETVLTFGAMDVAITLLAGGKPIVSPGTKLALGTLVARTTFAKTSIRITFAILRTRLVAITCLK